MDDLEFEKIPEGVNVGDTLVKVTGMYKDWFLDYASYVILERAVPAIYDGLKPVQRRILHSMKDLDDGRYNKVANIVGHTMQYHPHGDASIADAMVQIGQKELLIDTQGNWGNILTGDRAAASRYIEARLSKFALEVVFSPKVTDWQLSYDGRKKEPVHLPVKFPLLLAQGAEGIAVGLSTKILPHNFVELINSSIHHLKGKKFKLNEYESQWATGLNISNIGGKISYTESGDEDFLPMNLRIGARLSTEIDDYNRFMLAFDINKLLVPSPPVYDGSGDDEPENIIAGRNPNVGVVQGIFQSFSDAPGGIDEEFNELMYSVGGEYWYDNQFAFRFGYFHEHENKGNRKYFTLGASLKLNVFGIDLIISLIFLFSLSNR